MQNVSLNLGFNHVNWLQPYRLDLDGTRYLKQHLNQFIQLLEMLLYLCIMLKTRILTSCLYKFCDYVKKQISEIDFKKKMYQLIYLSLNTPKAQLNSQIVPKYMTVGILWYYKVGKTEKTTENLQS